jgi:two-component system, OmpR family, sensor histidine kinase KdpD
MYRFKRILSPVLTQKPHWRRYLWDTVVALIGTIAVTTVLSVFHLYPRIPNISMAYLVVVLALASTRGLYPAVLCSVVASLSFDFFLVPPFYTLVITRPEEWLALFIFLCTAILTGQLAAALRLRAEQARAYARETRTLYELLRDTNTQEDLDHQLRIIARAIVDVFASRGVRDCLILLPDETGRPRLRVSACQPQEVVQLTADESTTAAWVMREGQTVDLYDHAQLSGRTGGYSPTMVIRSRAMSQSSRRYLSFFPLKTGQKTGGVLCLVIEEDPRRLPQEKRLGSEADRSDPNAAFLWAFLDQAASMIEQARLRHESLQVELLQRTDALRAALVSSVSHDLRTPLTSIKAAASSLLQNDVRWDDEARRSFAQAIEHEADRLNRLVENLLDLSRIEGGALQAEKEWYPIDELIHDVLGRMQPLLQGREVKTDLPADLPPVELDYLMIDQVLTNMLENALRYTPVGSQIEISVAPTETEMVLSVADQGPGIPQAELERVFDKFYRVLNGTREASGTGVGLAVCRGLVEAHGGHTWAENRPGGGAIFRFTLPLHDMSGTQPCDSREGTHIQ